MDYNDLDTTLLKNSINQCINSINFKNIEKILQDINDNGIWNTKSREKFKNDLNMFINNDYKKLQNNLNEFMEITNQIDKYKNKSNEINKIDNLLIDLNNKIDTNNKNIDKDKIKENINDSKKQNENSLNELLKIKNQIERLLN